MITIDEEDRRPQAAMLNGAAMAMGRGNHRNSLFCIKIIMLSYYSNNLLEWIPMAHIDARDLPAPFVHGCLIVWYT